MTGVTSVEGGLEEVKSLIQSGTMNETETYPSTFGYTSTSFPTSGGIVYTVIYYDTYDFRDSLDLSNSLKDSLKSNRYDQGNYDFSAITDLIPAGRITGSMTKIINSSSDNFQVPINEAYTVHYYDKYGNMLRVISKDHMNGINVTSNVYEDITYDLIKTKEEYYRGNEHIILEKRYTYDHTGRLLETKLKVNDQDEITMNLLKYNETGTLISRYLHSDQIEGERSFVQKADYHYNIRGWLTKINDPGLGEDNDVFGMRIFYEQTDGLGGLSAGESYYNGNISGIKWGIRDEPVRGFRFTYDNLNRLQQTGYAEGSGLNQNQNYYTEDITQYDKNGNIKSLQRKYNNNLVDNLVYMYVNNNRSNQLLRVTDSGTGSDELDDYPGSSVDYTYDSNGNMTFDGSKSINIGYNRVLNLPVDLDFGNNRRIFFHYDATGRKVIKHVVKSGVPDEVIQYNGNIVYEGGQLSYILTEEGRLVADYSQSPRRFLYEYWLKDHLGNTRVVFSGKDLQGGVEILQKASYYPFGLVMKKSEYGTSTYPKNRYLYNGKEINSDRMNSESLNWYDYGARFYDPQIDRFHTQDRYAEKYINFSPYQYAVNNPLRYIDINGDSISVSQAFLKNELASKALSAILSTEAGYAYFSKFAAKGDAITIGDKVFSFDKDGTFSKSGIDLLFDVGELPDLKSGVTRPEISTSDNGLDLSIVIDTRHTKDAFNTAETIIHQVFLEANYMSNDFAKDGKLNYDNISSYVKDTWLKGDVANYGHMQNYMDRKTYGGENLLWPGTGYRVLLDVNKTLKSGLSNQQIQNTMSDFIGFYGKLFGKF